jgi:hypothetical protein
VNTTLLPPHYWGDSVVALNSSSPGDELTASTCTGGASPILGLHHVVINGAGGGRSNDVHRSISLHYVLHSSTLGLSRGLMRLALSLPEMHITEDEEFDSRISAQLQRLSEMEMVETYG